VCVGKVRRELNEFSQTASINYGASFWRSGKYEHSARCLGQLEFRLNAWFSAAKYGQMLGYLCSCICVCAFHKRQRFTLEILRSGPKRDGAYMVRPGLPFILAQTRWWHFLYSVCVCVCAVCLCVTGPTGSMEILLQYRSLFPEDWHAAFLVLGLVLHIFEFYFNFFLLYFSCQAVPAPLSWVLTKPPSPSP